MMNTMQSHQCIDKICNLAIDCNIHLSLPNNHYLFFPYAESKRRYIIALGGGALQSNPIFSIPPAANITM
ncbi:hypothetical protein E6O75_ATG06045 [Venturia nashicola]|uniref:Uncharacterized protein n=1 Tax=Venturia nashicola TaxID=86259 RepID=A0A4Z1NVE4_9PEZI|nr:hypothetical protein E6O75_ATG06045 [Venturia nashicola]